MEPSDTTPDAQAADAQTPAEESTPTSPPHPAATPDAAAQAPAAPEPAVQPEDPTAQSSSDAPATDEPATDEPASAAEPAAMQVDPPSEPLQAQQAQQADAAPAQQADAAGDDHEADDDEDDDDDDAGDTGAIEQNPEALSHDAPPADATAPADGAAAAGGDNVPAETAAGAEAPAHATDGAAQPEKKAPKPKPKKPAGPEPAEIVRRIGKTNEQALAYVLDPDPKLSRLSRKAREALITEVPPVTAGALLGPEALARHFIASAAAGRYRDLFALWELFRARPDECKPVLAERQRALDRGRKTLTTAIKLGMAGQADRVAEDVERAQGLIWTWVREVVTKDLAAVGRRPRIAAALLQREPDLDIPLPATPNDRWLAEAAAVKQDGKLPEKMDQLLSAHIERLPATVATLSQVAEQYPERLSTLVDRIDLESDNIGALLAWTRDHGMADRVRARIVAQIEEEAAKGRAEGLHVWQAWRDRGVDVDLPDSLRAPTIEGLDLSRPESADLIAQLIGGGAAIDPQAELEQLASQNRQAAEKAYEAFVCAGLDVHLPMALEGNPIVRDGTRCPACQAWTWVRPGHETRCPRRQDEAVAAS